MRGDCGMKCRICGTTLPDGAKFCPGCGAEVAADTQPKSKMDSNTVEDAYYREIDDAEYEAIKKKEKEAERIKEEAARQKAAEEKRAKEEAARWKAAEEKRAKEKAARWKAAEEKRAKEEAKKQKAEEEKRLKEEAWRKSERESKATKIYEGYSTPDRDSKNAQKRSKKIEDKQKKDKKDKQNEKKTGMSVVVYLIIILVGGFALYRTGIVDNIVSSMNKTSVEQKDSKEASGDTEATSETSKKNTEHTEEKASTNQVLADTDNHDMNANACLNTEAYHTVTSEDGSFSFGYPKYLFNASEVNKSGTSYTFSYKDASGNKEAELKVYTEPNAGNALENAKRLYNEYVSSVHKVYFKMQPTRIDSKGMARALIGGSADDSETTGVYIIAVNDGEKNYILKFTYPDPDIQYDYNAIDYVVDCVYRYCSFSGGTYQPRTYEQFLKDDMGTKK